MTKKFMSDKPTIEEIMRLRNKNRVSIDICINAEITQQIKDLERKHIIAQRGDVKQNRTPEAPRIKKEIEKLEQEALEYTVRFTFEDMGRKPFEDLWKSCPPTDEQKEQGYDWNPDDLNPKLMAATCVEAGGEDHLTLDQATTIYNTWSTAEAELLAMTAMNAQMGINAIPLSGSGIEGIQDTALSLITASTEESPTATSLADPSSGPEKTEL